MFIIIFKIFADILLFTATIKKRPLSSEPYIQTKEIDFKQEQSWYLDTKMLVHDNIVKNFIWAQWDANVQALYYILLRPSTKILLEKDDKDKAALSPTLSAQQFNDDLPTETVVSIYFAGLITFEFLDLIVWNIFECL